MDGQAQLLETASYRCAADALLRASVRFAGNEALVARSGRLTYRQLHDRVSAATAVLARRGIVPGDRVAVTLPNDVDVVVAFHAIMRAGAVFVGINRQLAPPEKRYLLDDSGTRLYLSEAGTIVDLPAGCELLVAEPGWLDPGDGERIEANAGVGPLDPAGISYTSGTTGRPKGAVHAQLGLLVPGAALIASRGFGPHTRKGDCLALTIMNLQVLSSLLVAQAGACSVVMDRSDPAGIAEWVRAEQVSVFNGVPTMWQGLVADATVTRADFASVVDLWSGGAPCAEAIKAGVKEKFGLPLTSTYGLTEAPTVVTIDPSGGGKPGASGVVLPHLRVQIAGDGEICVVPAPESDWVPPHPLMLGYWNRPEATDETVRDGVLHTGDLGHVDDDGYLYVTDRRSALILRGGANVYPAEVSRVLDQFPGVQSSAVVGLPDDRLGERVAALVETVAGTSIDEESLRRFMLGELARYKVPELFRFGAIPRNAMGKPVKADVVAILGEGDGRR